MHPERRTSVFGPFRLDPGHRTLHKGNGQVYLTPRSMDTLLFLVANAGRIVTRHDISDAVWRDTAVTDNSICQAITELRKKLGPQDDGTPYIETRIRQGYRFVAAVAEMAFAADMTAVTTAAGSTPSVMAVAGNAVAVLNTLLEPFTALGDGRASLETLNLAQVAHARVAFADALRHDANCAPAHVGLANACVMAYESTRADLEPDRAALAEAERHARTACSLDPASGDAWSVLALVLHATRARRDAVAAARKAVALDARDFRHQLTLASVSWGSLRLRAAYRALAMCPGLALGHWCAATVFVSRGAFDLALEHLQAGCALQDRQKMLSASGLHLLHGLVIAARASRAGCDHTGGHAGDHAGDSLAAARAELHRELALESSNQIYARECAANTWYAIGALALRENLKNDARAAFEQALVRVPGHALATCALGRAAAPPNDLVQAAIVSAARLSLNGDHAGAARVCGDALAAAPPGLDGWLLPVEPLLDIFSSSSSSSARRDAWTATLAVLHDRAV